MRWARSACARSGSTRSTRPPSTRPSPPTTWATLPRHTGQAWVRVRLDPDQIDYAPIPANALPAPRDGWRMLQLVTDRPWTLPLTGQPTAMQFHNVGLLRYGNWNPASPSYNSLSLWHQRGNVLDVRIPWAMAGISDPSSHQALIPRGEFAATSVTIPGISLTIAADGGPAVPAGTVRWQNWQAVGYTERIKPGAAALRQAFIAVSEPGQRAQVASVSAPSRRYCGACGFA